MDIVYLLVVCLAYGRSFRCQNISTLVTVLCTSRPTGSSLIAVIPLQRSFSFLNSFIPEFCTFSTRILLIINGYFNFRYSVLTETIMRFHQWHSSHPSRSACLLRYWRMRPWLYVKVIKSKVSFLSYRIQ
jgi:hypothetical protein